MATGPLTPTILARQTTALLCRQIKTDEPMFIAHFERLYDSDDLKSTLDSFTENYLEEAADTLANINTPVRNVPMLWMPAGVIGDRVAFRGLTVRVLLAFDVWHNYHRLRIDATWEKSLAWVQGLPTDRVGLR